MNLITKKPYIPPTVTVQTVEMQNSIAAGSASVNTQPNPTIQNETFGEQQGGRTNDW